MTSRFRILINPSMMRRDIGASYVLSELLEHMGCECYVAGTNTYTSRTTRWWNPHAIVYVTMERGHLLKELYPDAHLFYYPAEGGESYEFSVEKYLAEDRTLFDKITRVYLWGDFTRRHILRYAKELRNRSFLYGNESLLDEKCTIVGHPRLDLIRPDMNKQNSDEYTRIGLVGHFNMLNSISGQSATYKLLSGGNWEEMLFQVSLLGTYGKIIETLNPDRYLISIRPYPLEDVGQYVSCKWVREKRIILDQSIEFGVWAVQQDVIIGPTSSTLCQIAMAKRPFINLDALNNRSITAYKNSIRETFVDLVKHHCPKTFEELLNMIENYDRLAIAGEKFNDVMDDIYNSSRKGSSLMWVAEDIVKTLQLEPPRLTSWLPKSLMQRVHDLRYQEDPTSYSHFSFSQMEKALQKELDPIVRDILREKK